MSNLTLLANLVEQMAEMDITKSPPMQFRSALIDALVIKYKIPKDHAWKICARMNVNINRFDKNDKNWIRIVDGLSTSIKHMYTEYGFEYIMIAERLSIHLD